MLFSHKWAKLLALALTVATLVNADAKSDEADLVKKLRDAPTAVDRINLLATDDQFEFDFFDPKKGATVGAGGKIVTANAATFPAVIGTNSAMAIGVLNACSMNTPHMHPRATEMQYSVNGTIRTGMITENNARFVMTELPPGSMTIFPQGSIHFQVNDGCEPALFVASFNSEDPGALQVAQRFLGLPPDIVGATLGGLGVEQVAGLESKIPDNVAIGTDACLKRCGLYRGDQPTTQRQQRVSGNAFPSGVSASYETYNAGYQYTSKGDDKYTTSTAYGYDSKKPAAGYTDGSYTTPKAQSYGMATATVSNGKSTWKTTYTSYAGSAYPTYAPSPVNHLIKVGADGLYFSPSNISAAIGDTVTFEFHPKNHTVTQSSFLHPCKALAETSTTGEVGFKSGFVPVKEGTTSNFPTFKITVNDTAPIWGYCGQQGPPVHCTEGMVFSINAVESGPNNFAAFQDLARHSGDKSSTEYNTKTTEKYNTGYDYKTTSTKYEGGSYTTPKAQSYSMATATVSHGKSTWKTTYTSYAGSAYPTYAPSPVNHLIKVGADGLNFTPPSIAAAIGDTVTFEFHQKNHTVTQSSFLQPCKALGETSTTGQVGFKSGFVFVPPAQTSDFPTFSITVNDTAPIWGYCGQQGPPVHCTSGMVFAINAVESGPNNFAAFKELAMHSGDSQSSSSINCPPKDKDGSALTTSGSFVDSDGGNLLASCTYPSAGLCAYFSDGSFSSGSSTCPAGLPQASDFGKSKTTAAGKVAAAVAVDGTSSDGDSKKPSPALIALIAINGALVVGLIVLGALYFRKRRAAARMSRHKQLYTSVSATGDPLFVAPTKLTQYEDKEGHAAAEAGDEAPLTHGLTHGPYYDPHEPHSRPASRMR